VQTLGEGKLMHACFAQAKWLYSRLVCELYLK
jgi:hypothetical protein